jgi:redox-sensing transcriptional repressor
MSTNQPRPGLPRPTLRRLPVYYRQLRRAAEEGIKFLSSADLAQSADVSEAQVRKDLSYLDLSGRSGVGYDVVEMAAFLEEFLGLVNDKEAVLVGMGNLGQALVLYPGFARYGLRIVAGFDNDLEKIGTQIGACHVLAIGKLPDLARRMNIQIGIITVSAEAAQAVADLMVEGGIQVIWNFAPRRLRVPENVIVKDQDLAVELATLSHLITQRKLVHSVTPKA